MYFHCNWGWDGYANGYFLSNAFDVYTNDVQMVNNITSPNSQE